MEKGTELLHGYFHFKVLSDGGVDRTKVICNHCQVEFSYHRSTSSLKYHLNAKHTVDTSKSFNETDSGGRLRQTTYSRVTASSELFGASPHSNINALAVAISFSFVFVLITLFKLRITQSIYFI